MITLGEDGLAKVKSGVDDARGAAARRHRSAGGAHAVPRVRRRGRRRLHRLPALRQAAQRRLPELRPRAAAGLEFLSLLREQHTRPSRAAEAAARSRRTSRRPARAAGRQRRGVQEVDGAEELLRAPRSRRRAADEIKKAFRAQIARYHPDKVQHLGQEFQEMAARRAAELTEAYRILSDEAAARNTTGRRRRRAGCRRHGAGRPPQHGRAATGVGGAAAVAGHRASRRTSVHGGARRARTSSSARRRSSRLRTGDRRRSAADYDESQLRGFDLALTPPKQELFGRSNEAQAARDVRPDASIATRSRMRGPGRANGATRRDEVCVLLLGTALAPASELAGAITEQRQEVARRQVTLMSRSTCVTGTRVPPDAPAVGQGAARAPQEASGHRSGNRGPASPSV